MYQTHTVFIELNRSGRFILFSFPGRLTLNSTRSFFAAHSEETQRIKSATISPDMLMRLQTDFRAVSCLLVCVWSVHFVLQPPVENFNMERWNFFGPISMG